MATEFAAGPYSLAVVAETGDQFADFTPYVAAINDDGTVVFSATLTEGGSGVFRSDVGRITTVADSTSGSFNEIRSHPDIDGSGSVCFYAENDVGVTALFGARSGEIVELSAAAGPLGPTVNVGGTIGFRAPLAAGGEGVFASRAGTTTTIADTNGRFSAFHGLPVVDRLGRVVFRADTRDGHEGIFVHLGDRLETVVETGEEFAGLGLFPFAGGDRTIVFCAERHTGSAGVFTAAAGTITQLIGPDPGLESFRGALLTGRGELVYYATPTGRDLRIITGPDIERDCLLAVGGRLLDSTVVDFALNPVSINDAGQLAIRVATDNGRQLILRADPVDAA